MICCGSRCCEADRHTVLIVGSGQHKTLFLKNILNIDYDEEAFSESEIKYNSVPLILQSVELGANLNEIQELHSKVACGIVYLSNQDMPLSYDNHTLFVLVGGKSKQTSDERTVVASVQNDSWDECKMGFDKLVDNLNKH